MDKNQRTVTTEDELRELDKAEGGFGEDEPVEGTISDEEAGAVAGGIRRTESEQWRFFPRSAMIR